MGLFNITWRTQVTNLLPSFLRSTSLVDYITALLEPLKTKATEWNTFDIEIRKRAKFNSQIIILRSALNNLYGITIAPFILVETQQTLGQGVFFYNESEGIDPVFFYNEAEGELPTYFYNDSEIGDGFDFVVKIPDSIYTAELDRQVSSETRIYKLAGKKFKVEQYTP